MDAADFDDVAFQKTALDGLLQRSDVDLVVGQTPKTTDNDGDAEFGQSLKEEEEEEKEEAEVEKEKEMAQSGEKNKKATNTGHRL
uniref:Uncharacterized protein n=1 Tax=Caenorhabditis tropicalis TaxID=1561998 RepID=A0A1I7TVW4_9PELO